MLLWVLLLVDPVSFEDAETTDVIVKLVKQYLEPFQINFRVHCIYNLFEWNVSS